MRRDGKLTIVRFADEQRWLDLWVRASGWCVVRWCNLFGPHPDSPAGSLRHVVRVPCG